MILLTNDENIIDRACEFQTKKKSYKKCLIWKRETAEIYGTQRKKRQENLTLREHSKDKRNGGKKANNHIIISKQKG